MSNKQFTTLVVGLILLLALVLVFLPKGRDLGSVTVGNEYYATSSAPWTGAASSHTIDRGWGTLGSVVVTKAGDMEFYLLDATNTPELVDAYATTSDALVYIPASLAAGTYTFDINYTDGLYFYLISGGTGTSTITWR